MNNCKENNYQESKMYKIQNFVSTNLPYIYLGLIIFSLLLNSLLLSQEIHFQFKNHSNVLQVIFGVTSGILTFIGLVAIYTSVNTQHNIQKCREIVWDIEELAVELNSLEEIKKSSKSIIKKLRLYGEIINKSGNYFNNKIVDLTQWAIIGVTFLWLLAVNLFNLQSFIEYILVILVSLVGVFIISWFSHVIGDLKNVTSLGGLTPLIELINYKGDEILRKVLLLGNRDTNLFDGGKLSMKFKLPFLIDYGIELNDIEIFNKSSSVKRIWGGSLHPKRGECFLVEGMDVSTFHKSWKITQIKESDFQELLEGNLKTSSLNHGCRYTLTNIKKAEEVKYDRENNQLYLTEDIDKITFKYSLFIWTEKLDLDSKYFINQKGYIDIHCVETIYLTYSENKFSIREQEFNVVNWAGDKIIM
jgi:hypothetical protein